MPQQPTLAMRSTLEELRLVFLGAASRHDGVQCRWVIAESGYNQYLQGPNDQEWAPEKLIAFSSFTLREGGPYLVTSEQQQQIMIERPGAQFGSFQGGDEVYYLAPSINSSFLLRGNHAARDAFGPLSHDAGFCLLQLLQNPKLKLKLPELVPLDAIATVRARAASTNLPTDLSERWLAFLHILGWQNLPLSPLRARRSIWHEHTSILGDPAELQKALNTSIFQGLRDKIPLPARYLASTMQTDVSLASVYAIDAVIAGMIDLPDVDVERLVSELQSIPAGSTDATRYHALVKKILAVIFEPDLHSPICEEKLHEGRGRIDIVFANAAERGYFADLPFRHRIMCPVVFFECKNYSTDIGGPEFAQLVSRFSDRRSNVGFITCRKIEDKTRAEDRCRDRFQDKHEHILVLDDADLAEMLKLKANGKTEAVSNYLHAKFRPIFMNQ